MNQYTVDERPYRYGRSLKAAQQLHELLSNDVKAAVGSLTLSADQLATKYNQYWRFLGYSESVTFTVDPIDDRVFRAAFAVSNLLPNRPIEPDPPQSGETA